MVKEWWEEEEEGGKGREEVELTKWSRCKGVGEEEEAGRPRLTGRLDTEKVTSPCDGGGGRLSDDGGGGDGSVNGVPFGRQSVEEAVPACRVSVSDPPPPVGGESSLG